MWATATLFGIFITTPKNKKPPACLDFNTKEGVCSLFFIVFYDIIVQYSTRAKLNEI